MGHHLINSVFFQGEIISPFLFSMYTNDVKNCLANKHCIRVESGMLEFGIDLVICR